LQKYPGKIILISKEYLFFPTRSGENRFTSSLDKEKKVKGEREIYILMLQISEFYMANLKVRRRMQILKKKKKGTTQR